MSDAGSENAAELEPELRDMKLEEGAPPDGTAGENGDGTAQVKAEDTLAAAPTAVQPAPSKARSRPPSPAKPPPSDASSPDPSAHEQVLGGEITLKMEPGKAPRLARTASHKVVSRPPTLYLDLPDATAEAQDTFVVLSECSYANKTIGTTEHALECDCSEEWGKLNTTNTAPARMLFCRAAR